MARNSQKLINYHGTTEFGSSQLADLKIGEIAVKHSADGNAQLIIKTGSNDESTSQAIFIESVAVATMISEATSAITNDITTLSSATVTLQGDLTNLEDEVETFSGTVVNEYATKQEVENAITDVYNSANTYTDAAIEELSGDVITYVDTKVTSVYRYKGTKATYEELPESGNVTGDVWNVEDAHGTTPAGTNYAWTGSGWDALGGIIDLSIYATTEYVDGQIDALSATYATTDTVNDINTVLTAHTTDATIHVTSAQTEVWDAALQGFSLTGTGASSTGTQSTQCGVIANYTTGGTATLDLSAIVIDCGNW